MQFQTNSAAIKHRQQFIKFNDKVVEPYFNERYKYKTISNTSKINGLNDMQKTTEEETLKIFDDRTLEYNSKHKDLLQITQLDLRNSQITDNGIYFLAISKNAQNIKKIDLSQNTYNIQDAALRFISDSPFLQNLEILLLGDTTITDYGIRYLFQPFSQSIELDTKFAITNFQKTKTKKVVNTQLGSMQYGSQLTQASDSQTQYSEMKQSLLRMQNLKILDLSGNISITDKSVDCITYSTNIKLKYLDLSFTKITDLGLMDYMISPNSEELEYLNVSNQQITDVSIKTLCDSLHCTQLVVLKLNSCPITKLSIEYLADSMNTMNLEELDIGTREQKTELTDEALMKLIKPKFLGKLRVLNLQGQAFSEFRINQLFSSTICRSLQELNISHNPEITDNSCKSIASLNLDLKKLNLLKTSVTSKGIEILQTMSAIQVSHSIANMPAIVQSIINIQLVLNYLFVIDVLFLKIQILESILRCVQSAEKDRLQLLNIRLNYVQVVGINSKTRIVIYVGDTMLGNMLFIDVMLVLQGIRSFNVCSAKQKYNHERIISKIILFQIQYNKKMDSLDLMEIRKKLHSYKKTGKKNVMSILKQLHEATITISQLNESKINKTIRTLAKLQIKDLVDSDYLEQDLIQLKQKASELYVKFSQMSENDQFRKQSLVSEAKSNVSEQQQSQQPQQQQQSQQSSQSQGMDSQEDLIKKLELPHDYSAIRVKVIQTLLSRVLNGKYDNPKLNKVADFEIAKFVKKLEFEINLRHNEKHYQSAIKEVLKYISMDKDGSVRNRLLSGIIDAPTAALLKSEDWTSEQKLKEATQIGRESIKANDLMHNKKLAQDINKDTPLGLCNNCNQKSLKMVNEIQTRASDEPSTKFWECINCGISETTNG